MRCGEGLEQVHRLAADDRRDPLCDLAVVHGVGDVVARRRGRSADVQRRVDDEVLTVPPLVLVDAVAPEDTQARSG